MLNKVFRSRVDKLVLNKNPVYPSKYFIIDDLEETQVPTHPELERQVVDNLVANAECNTIIKESEHTQVPKHLELARQGRMLEAGAVAEGLVRIIGMRIGRDVANGQMIQSSGVSIVWKLEDGTEITQVDSINLDSSIIDVDFTGGEGPKELLAYVRDKYKPQTENGSHETDD